MNKYTVNNIFKEDAVTLEELITNFFITFLDEQLNNSLFNDIINSDTILNLIEE